MKKCSVVIPAHNEESYIEKTLQSIIIQDYPNIEIIVVDNDSNDSTAKIAKKYTNSVITFNKKHGASASRNFGVKKSTGEYIAFLDADSCLSSNAISNLIKILDKGYSGGSCRIIPPEDRVIAIAQTILANKWPRFLGPMYTPYVFTTRKIYEETGGWDENRELGEEIDFQRRLLSQGKLKLDNDSYVTTSPRRYIEKGYVRTTLYGVVGYIGYNTKWVPIR
jgi:glycosyltransferase involved in cell wall biosynthesis